jgi:hypothetical protein
MNAVEHAPVLREAGRTGNPRVLASLAGPALRGLVLQQGKAGPSTAMPAAHAATFDWTYERDAPELRRLTSAARTHQWDPDRDLDWSIQVDPHHPERALIPEEMLMLRDVPIYRTLPARVQREHHNDLLAWLLSQFLHGEQGALFVACQLTEAVGWLDGKLYGSTQVVDEGRHVEVFTRYLQEKLGKSYRINDNLFVVLDSVLRDARWDVKFLGMQILVEGLALGAFGTLHATTREPLLKELLRRVITDEARHVHFGVVALERLFRELSPAERREREDWAYEMCLLARNRFLAHEFWEEHYAASLPRREWDQVVMGSAFMARFRETLFRRVIPNLKRIGLLSPRIRPHYQALGLLAWEHERAAPDLSAQDLLATPA